ncbi:PAAR domain-containing protein [Ningiella sp. W23]|uniref:PAAR domain-containing protein n=1 Tax=Ningiella sp. W23 TaxID=3023715 RepID=UPI003757DCA3
MGKPAARKGDIGSNHGAWHPSPIIAGSGDVFINHIPAARKGDALAPHVKPKSPPHGRSISQGAPTVFINNKPAARVGDAIDCGGSVAMGSPNVFIGDDSVSIESVGIPLVLKSVIIRLNINPEIGSDIKDTFTLSSADGSYKESRTVKDDMMPGDEYLDLLYENLNPSLLYSLDHQYAVDGTTTQYFTNISYTAMSLLS